MADIITYTETDADAVAHKAFEVLTSAADAAIRKKGCFVLALAGGNTPKQLYTLLKNHTTDWHQWFLVYGDERCLPLNHTDRNSNMVQNTWLNAVHFPAENHFIVPADSVTDAALQYSKSIAPLLPIDFALLGIGEDGHTASLFPGNMAIDSQSNDTVIAVKNSPKVPTERISLSYQALNEAAIIGFIATGKTKNAVLNDWQKNPDLPFNLIHGKEKTFLIADKQAYTNH
jgi:6-phosphogluconolactonase